MHHEPALLPITLPTPWERAGTMTDVLKELGKLIPLTPFFESLGVEKTTSVILESAGIILLATLISALFTALITTLWKYLVHRWKTARAARDLNPYFDYITVKNACRHFIPTQFQSISPTREDELQSASKYIPSVPLIPFFIKTAFNEKKESNKFYLVLAGSGMGKTTFIINLYLRYTSFFNRRKKYKIKLFPFGHPGTLDVIKKIDVAQAKNTILLLDAFDEDKLFISGKSAGGKEVDEGFRARMDEIIEAVRDFREVVITSRTQYFPGQEETAYELKIPRLGAAGFHSLVKCYISPFTTKEIRTYLRKKYGLFRLWNRKKKRRAQTIVARSPRLMVRPMLLSYIDYLVDDTKEYATTYEIYEILINKWIQREAAKRKHKTTDRKRFTHDLCEFSRLVALEIYKQQVRESELSLEKDKAVAIAHENHLDLSDYEITGQSLLTRDAAGNWKFAHKSVYEFLLAREAATNSSFWMTCTFTGMDMAEKFFREKQPDMPLPGNFVFIKGGRFTMGSPEDEPERRSDETQHEVVVRDFFLGKYPVTVGEFEMFITETGYKTDADKAKGDSLELNKRTGTNWRCDVNGNIQEDKRHPVMYVSWNDATEYCKWLSKKTGMEFRLPTEAEWEYACRAGTATPFSTGKNITTDQANYNGNYPYTGYPKGKYVGKTTPVGTYPPNAWGVYDMHGNVWEWCSDWYGKDYYDICKNQGVVTDPRGPEFGADRVLRGGGWYRKAGSLRSAYRSYVPPDRRFRRCGFRLSRGQNKQE
jgi:formylglycine-generating enzyme